MKKTIFAVLTIFIFNMDIIADFGVSAPLVKDKVYIGPYLDFHARLFGFLMDGGLIYTKKKMEAIDDKTWLGYFANGLITVNVIHEKNFTLKIGAGYSFHHLIHIDETLRYHALPLALRLNYRFPTGASIFYHIDYPLVKSSDFIWKQDMLHKIGIGFGF